MSKRKTSQAPSQAHMDAVSARLEDQAQIQRLMEERDQLLVMLDDIYDVVHVDLEGEGGELERVGGKLLAILARTREGL